MNGYYCLKVEARNSYMSKNLYHKLDSFFVTPLSGSETPPPDKGRTKVSI